VAASLITAHASLARSSAAESMKSGNTFITDEDWARPSCAGTGGTRVDSLFVAEHTHMR